MLFGSLYSAGAEPPHLKTNIRVFASLKKLPAPLIHIFFKSGN